MNYSKYFKIDKLFREVGMDDKAAPALRLAITSRGDWPLR
jgi:hypothetical protein